MRRSFTQYVEETFSKEITAAIEQLVENTNTSGLEVSVSKMSVWQIDLNCLYRYEDYAELPIIVSATIQSEEDGQTFSRRMFMRGKMSGTFSERLEDFEINLSDILKTAPKKTPMKVWDDLLLKTNRAVVRFTIMHELIHAYVQRFAIWFIQMCNRIYGEFRCPTRSFDEFQFLDDFLERAERQADYGASLALMPKEAFRLKAEEILKSYGFLPEPNDIRKAVERIAEFFDVSVSAAKRMMTQLDFEEANGVFNFVDGQYVPPFGYRKGFLEKDETFVISAEQLRSILKTDRKMAKHISHGRVCFVENHLVINTPDYVEGNGAKARLTDHARKHMDECAFKFKLIFQNAEIENQRYVSNSKIAYRSATTLQPIVIIISDSNTTVEQKADLLKERSADITAISKKISNDFPSSLDAVIQWSEMEPKDIAVAAWVNPKTLYNLRTNDSESPSLLLMIRLCIAMKLPTEVSYRLIECSGCGKRCNVEDIGCAQFLEAPGAFTVELAHNIMVAQGRKGGLGGCNPAA